METEARKKARRNYREAHATISITVTKEIKEVMDKAAEASGKSKAQYIVVFFYQVNNIL